MTDDTICAVATAPGRGGVGIVRISGTCARSIGESIIGRSIEPRHAQYGDFSNHRGQLLDQGIALFFPQPHSFTGEDVFELQAHGGPVILDLLIETCLQAGARLARPGEFSERAFLNDKMDLTQAEAIADLIDANSRQAAMQAVNTLKGAFAREIETLVSQLTELRLFVESAIDFPEEEIDFLNDGHVEIKLSEILKQTQLVLEQAQQGSIMREGMKVALAGRPNAGKSTLLNALAERDVAIVTDVAGTTRDTLTEHIHLDGMPLHITDTAGIRDTEDKVERMGIERAWRAIHEADQILLLVDATELENERLERVWPEFFSSPELMNKLTLVANKVDLLSVSGQQINNQQLKTLAISALNGSGIAELKQHLLNVIGLQSSNEGQFSARRRHLDALHRAIASLETAQTQLLASASGELVAEDLRLAQQYLGEITGKVSADDLLGHIFSSFCIGK